MEPGAVACLGSPYRVWDGLDSTGNAGIAAGSLGARALGRSRSLGVGGSAIKPITGERPQRGKVCGNLFSCASRPWTVRGAIRRRQSIVSQY